MLAPARWPGCTTRWSSSTTGGIATATSIVTPEGDTSARRLPAVRATLQEMADGFAGDDGGDATDTAALLDDEVRDGLNQSLDYVNGLARRVPRRRRRAPRCARPAAGIAGRPRTSSSGSATRASSRPSSGPCPRRSPRRPSRRGRRHGRPPNADERLPRGARRGVPRGPSPRRVPRRRARRARLEDNASIAAALSLADAFDRLADHFEDQPDATPLAREPGRTHDAPASSSARPSSVFDDLPDQFGALSAVFATRPDDSGSRPR